MTKTLLNRINYKTKYSAFLIILKYVYELLLDKIIYTIPGMIYFEVTQQQVPQVLTNTVKDVQHS